MFQASHIYPALDTKHMHSLDHQIIQKERNTATYKFERAVVDGQLEPFVVLNRVAKVELWVE